MMASPNAFTPPRTLAAVQAERRARAIFLCLIAVLAILPVAADPGSAATLLSLSGLYAMSSIGFQIAFGWLRLLLLAYGAAFGIGAYLGGLGHQVGAGDFAILLPVAVVTGLLISGVIHLICRRLSGHSIALASISLAALIHLAALNWVGLTGGANGITLTAPFTLLGIPLPRGVGVTVVIGVFVFGAALITARLRESAFGAAAWVMASAPHAARSAGLPMASLQLSLIAPSICLTVVAGVFYPAVLTVVSPAVTDFRVMVTILTIAVLAGPSRVLAVIPAALFVVQLPHWFQFLEQAYWLIYAALILFVLGMVPGGLSRLAGGDAQAGSEPDEGAGEGAAMVSGKASAPSSSAVITLDAVTVRFADVIALNAVSARFAGADGPVGIIGPNGSGKTTLLNVADGTIDISAGFMTAEPANCRIGRTVQHRETVDGLPPVNAIAVAAPDLWQSIPSAMGHAIRHGSNEHTWEAARLKAAALLGRITGDAGSEGNETTQPPSASPPQGLCDLATVLMAQPAILLLDEPSADLTPEETASLAAFLGRLARDGYGQGASPPLILVVDHDLAFIRSVARSAICLHEGRIVGAGPVEELLASSDVQQLYLGKEGSHGTP